MSKKFTAVRLLCAFGIAFVLTVAIIFGVSEEPVTAIYNLFLGPLQSKRHFFDVFASSVPLIFTVWLWDWCLNPKLFHDRRRLPLHRRCGDRSPGH